MSFSIENRAKLAFAIMVLFGLVAGAIWYHLTSGRFTTYEILTQDSVSGLMVGAPVEFHGVDVGTVSQVDLTGPRSVRILLKVEKDAPVSGATVATITARGLATRGFTGYVYILLEDTGTDQSPLATAAGSTYPRLPSAPSRSVNLDTAISQVNQNVQILTELVRALLDGETIASLKQTAANLQKVSQVLAGNQERLASIIANTEQASGQLGPLLVSSNDTMTALRQTSRMLAENQERLSAIIVNTEQASGQLGPLLASSNDTINALQIQVLPEAYRSMANLNKLANSMERLTEKLNRDPSILVRGTTPPSLGPGETR